MIAHTPRRRTIVVVLALLFAGSAGSADAEPTITHGDVISFDQTPIAYTLFVPDGASSETPTPIVFFTHGWGGRRERTVAGIVKVMTDAGYAVITWDQRGFGDSGGESQVASMDHEVRDVQALIDFVADPASSDGAIMLDGDGDPRMGMIGGSYAGGIQLLTASVDQRIDALIPQIAWNDVPDALRPGGVLKQVWDFALYGAGAAGGTAEGLDAPGGPRTGGISEMIYRAAIESVADNDWSDETAAWFDERSIKHYIMGTDTLPGVHAPTLLLQGVNDTLFPINHAIANYDALRANGVEARLIFFCGFLAGTTFSAHSLRARGTCEPADQGPYLTAQVLAWFERHLRDNPDAPIGAPVSYQTQDGTFATASGLPDEMLAGSGSGRLMNTFAPTSSSHAVSTPGIGGVRITIPDASGRTLLGVPEVSITLTGSGAESFVFLRLLDVSPLGQETVIDDQVGARKFTDLSSTAQHASLRLPGVVWTLAPGHELVLEVSTTSADHASSRHSSEMEIGLSIRVPVR